MCDTQAFMLLHSISHRCFIRLLLFQGNVQVGPESVGYELTSKSLCFNGDTCTATDIAIAAGIVKGDFKYSLILISV